MIAIVDYGRGNLFSIARALEKIGEEPLVTSSPDVLRRAQAVVLPGVGAFRDAMAGLDERRLGEAVRELAEGGVPLLGICLGMQLLFSRSEEFGDCQGLDLIPGAVCRLPAYSPGSDAVRVPNVGWRRLQPVGDCPLLQQVSAGAMFYFVHSFVPVPTSSKDVAGTLDLNGRRAAVMVRRDNIFGCQFHPEKSGPEGLALLRGFADYAAETGRERNVA